MVILIVKQKHVLRRLGWFLYNSPNMILDFEFLVCSILLVEPMF